MYVSLGDSSSGTTYSTQLILVVSLCHITPRLGSPHVDADIDSEVIHKYPTQSADYLGARHEHEAVYDADSDSSNGLYWPQNKRVRIRSKSRVNKYPPPLAGHSRVHLIDKSSAVQHPLTPLTLLPMALTV